MLTLFKKLLLENFNATLLSDDIPVYLEHIAEIDDDDKNTQECIQEMVEYINEDDITDYIVDNGYFVLYNDSVTHTYEK